MDSIASGLQKDFDNMTKEVGIKVQVYPRKIEQNYEGHHSEEEDFYESVEETVVIQELNSTHEMVTSGLFDIGDVEVTFLSNSIIEPEGYVFINNSWYKIITINYYRGMGQNEIMYVTGFGKKVQRR